MVCGALLCLGCKKKQPPNHQELLVFAAASLNDVFSSIVSDFEEKHPDIDVQISFAGSQSLRTQIENGARPDVFASANEEHLDALIKKGFAKNKNIFALNQMVVALYKDRNFEIKDFKDILKVKSLVLAGASVPAGAYAEEVLAKATKAYGLEWRNRLEEKVVSRETHVRQTLQKVILGEADAAIVYATDVASTMENISVVGIPDEFNIRAHYPIAEIGGNENAKIFVDFLSSKMGKEKLQLHGFLLP